MVYRFPFLPSYDFLSAGSVLYGGKGIPNFPVKLANEIFHRCREYSDKKDSYSIYDPCCGGGYLLTTISFLNYPLIDSVYASDIDTESLKVAEKNLLLLTTDGMGKRLKELNDLFHSYQKVSHQLAIEHAQKLEKTIQDEDVIRSEIFRRNILEEPNTHVAFSADIIMTDVPYGNLVTWQGQNGINKMMDNLKLQCNSDTTIAIIHDKYQKLSSLDYQRMEKFKVGKRIIEILKIDAT